MAAVRPFVDVGAVPGAVVGVSRDGLVSMEAAGTTATSGGTAMSVDTLARISSNTKPMAAVLTLALAEEGALGLDDPIERFVPELADRRVLRQLDGPLEDTVPAERSATIEDLLTMRLGFGFVFEADCPAVAAAGRAKLGIGPPDPSVPLTPDAWVARFAKLPLMEQPGTAWRYDLAYAVLGVVLARAGRCSLDELLRARLFEPLGMTDTAFFTSPGRLPPCYAVSDARLVPFDTSSESRWAIAPAFPDARGGLVSSTADLLRFAEALLDDGSSVVSAASVAAMTTDQLTPEQRRGPSAQTFLGGLGWGYGVQVASPEHEASVRSARYGWGGGLGTLWYSWPDEHTAAVLLTQVLPPSPELVTAFVNEAERSLAAP